VTRTKPKSKTMKTKSKLLLIALAVAGSAACLIAQDSGNNAPRHQRGMGPDQMGPRGHRPPPPPVIAVLDANHDGVIDADEIANASKALLKLDKNGDGKLTPEELHPPRPMDGDAPDHQGPPPFGHGGPGHPPFDEQDGPPADAPEQN
jgi:hypothetical protein